MKRRSAQLARAALGTVTLLACSPHRDPTEPHALAATPKDTFIGHVLLATDEMYDEHRWFAPSRCRPIKDAAVPFAIYLNQLHAKLHVHFASEFLAYADTQPKAHPLQDRSLATTVGLIISGRDGHVVRRSVLRSSGSTFFDIAALDAIDRSAPFDAAPPAISSPDGNVYIHWELRRDQMACSTSQAHPYLLK